MRSNRNYDQITYEKLLDELFKDAENEIEDIADLDRRAHKLSVKKELERLQHLQLIPYGIFQRRQPCVQEFLHSVILDLRDLQD